MSVFATTAYSLSEETGLGLEICKIALEKAKQNAELARQILARWNNKPTTNNKIEENHGLITTSFDKESQTAAGLKISTNNYSLANSKEFYKLAEDIVQELTLYDEPYVAQAYLPTIESKNNCKIHLEYQRLNKSSKFSLLTTYTHRNKIGVLLETRVDNLEAFNNKLFRIFSFDCAMHIAAFLPLVINEKDFPKTNLDTLVSKIEKELFAEGKDINLWSTVIDGKTKKWKEQRSLLTQIFIKNEKETVDNIREIISGNIQSNIEIVKYHILTLD